MTAPQTKPEKVGPFRVAPHIRNGVPSGRWMIDIPPHVSETGKRQRSFFENKSAATTEARRLARELQIDGALRGRGPRPSGVQFAELAKRWLAGQADRVATSKKRVVSLKKDAARLKALLSRFANRDIAAISSDDLVEYQKHRLAEPRSPATVNSELRLLKQILGWAADRDFLRRVPKVEPIPEPRRRVEVPTINEVMAIIEVLPPNIALLVHFLADTGCRKGEAFFLEWNDLREDEGYVMIRSKEGWTPKTAHSDRDIPLSPSLAAALAAARSRAFAEARMRGDGTPRLVFPGKTGGRMWDFRKTLKSAINKTGITRNGQPIHISPHLFRKAQATWLKERGIDDTLVQPKLGHAPGSSVTSKNYVHHSSDALRGAVIDLREERSRREARPRSVQR